MTTNDQKAAPAKMVQIDVPQEWLETTQVLRSHVPFMTEALGVLPLLAVENAEFPAFTDMRSITVCPSKWDEIRENTINQGMTWFPTEACARAVLLLHETGHIIFRSETRRGNRDHLLWVEATDNAINEFVVGVFQMPPFNYRGDKLAKLEAAMAATGSYQKRFHGMTAEEIYEVLKKEQQNGGNGKQPPQQPPPPGAGAGGGAGQPGKQPAKGKGDKSDKGDPSNEDGDGNGGEGGNGDGSGSGNGGSDISDMFGDDFGPNVQDSEVPDDLGELVENALKDYAERNGDKLHSPHGSAACRELTEAAKKPPVKLSEIVRKLRDTPANPDYNYMRLGKNDTWAVRRGTKWRLPSPIKTERELIKELVVVIDASGSMSDAELRMANRIVADAFKCVKDHKVRRLVFTTQVVDDADLTPEVKAPIHHTGGTCISSIIDYFEKPHLHKDPKRNGKPIKPSAIVLITDGYDMPDSIKRFESWKHLPKLRTILIKNPQGVFPGIHFHVDVIE